MQIDDYIRHQRLTKHFIAASLSLLIILTLSSMFVGQYGMSFWDTLACLIGKADEIQLENIQNIIINIRIPRTVAAIVIGGVLAIAGLTYQCVFRNTLVSQDILGISTSACVGAAIGIVMELSTIHIQVLAFSLGVVNILLIFLLSSRIKLEKTLSLILSGILIGGAMSSILALIKYLANPEVHLQAIVFWTMGDISSISLKQLALIALPLTMGTVIIFTQRWTLNYFCFSDHEAKSMGVNIGRKRILLLASATVLVASAVSVSGSIGWIGLVIPQLVRIMIGTDNRFTVSLSFLMGSSYLLLVDLINRLITAAELPVNIISGLLGLPLFIVCWFINVKRRGLE